MLKPPADRLTAVLLAWLGAATTTSALTMFGMFGYFGFLLASGGQTGSTEPAGASIFTLYGLLFTLTVAGYAMFFALIAFGIGLAVFAAPIWWALHKLKLTNPLAFALTGAGLSVASGMVAGMEYLPLTPPLAIPGGVAGWLIWLLGYTRAQAASQAST